MQVRLAEPISPDVWPGARNVDSWVSPSFYTEAKVPRHLALAGRGLHHGGVERDDLSEPERLLWSAFPKGEWIDLRSGDPDDDKLANADRWGPDRDIRAGVIIDLLLGGCRRTPGTVPALRLRGARIVGRVDLMGATSDHAFVCEHCVFDSPLRLVEADLKTVRIVSSLLPSVNGTRVRILGILNFYDSLIRRGIRLDRARVTGEISFWGAAIGADPDGTAIAADGLTVDGPLECNNGFTADGAVLLRGARIDGDADFTDAIITRPGSDALNLDRAAINGRLFAQRMRVAGQLSLKNAHIAGSMHLSAARLDNPGGIALGAGGLVIQGGIWCRDGFAADGEVRMVGAELRGNLALDSARLNNPGAVALSLSRAILGDFDGGGLSASGEVRLIGTQITGRFNLSSAELDSAGSRAALFADNAAISGAATLQGLRANGEICLRSCTIHRLLLTDARLHNARKVALRLSRTEVGADVVCGAMEVTGTIRTARAQIVGHLDLTKIILSNPDGIAMDAPGLQAGELSLLPTKPIEGAVVLEHARIGVLRDDPSSWPDNLRINELTYEVLSPPLSGRERLNWIQGGGSHDESQPYEQLAAYYNRSGRRADALRVLYAKERRNRSSKPLLIRLWSTLQDITVGYGYQPSRAVLWLAALLTLGSIVYGLAPPPPLKAGGAPHFNSVIYTLDLLLPVVDLGQKHTHNPAGAEQWLSYLLVAAGWALATTIATAIARVLSRRP